MESQYDTYSFVSAYDSIADWPDRTDNWMSLLNSIAGLATGHTAVAFTNPRNVPARNIRTTVNSRGGRTTTFMIPEQHLPLVMPFKYLGWTKTPSTGSTPSFSRWSTPVTRATTTRHRADHRGSGQRLRSGRGDRAGIEGDHGDQVGDDPFSQMLALLGSFGSADDSAGAPPPPPLAAEAPG